MRTRLTTLRTLALHETSAGRSRLAPLLAGALLLASCSSSSSDGGAALAAGGSTANGGAGGSVGGNGLGGSVGGTSPGGAPATGGATGVGGAIANGGSSNGGSAGSADSATLTATIDVPDVPGTLAYDGTTNLVWVGLANSSVVAIDPATDTIAKTVVTADTPGAIAVDETKGKVFVLADGNGEVGVLYEIDEATAAISNTYKTGQFTKAMAIDSAGGQIYVAVDGIPSGDPGSILVIDEATGATVVSIPLPKDAIIERLGIDPTQHALYAVAHIDPDASGNETGAYKIDTTTNAITSTASYPGLPIGLSVMPGNSRVGTVTSTNFIKTGGTVNVFDPDTLALPPNFVPDFLTDAATEGYTAIYGHDATTGALQGIIINDNGMAVAAADLPTALSASAAQAVIGFAQSLPTSGDAYLTVVPPSTCSDCTKVTKVFRIKLQ